MERNERRIKRKLEEKSLVVDRDEDNVLKDVHKPCMKKRYRFQIQKAGNTREKRVVSSVLVFIGPLVDKGRKI